MPAPATTPQARYERRRYHTKPTDLEDLINDACRFGPVTIADLRSTLKVAGGFIESSVLKMVQQGELREVDWILQGCIFAKAYVAAKTQVSA